MPIYDACLATCDICGAAFCDDDGEPHEEGCYGSMVLALVNRGWQVLERPERVVCPECRGTGAAEGRADECAEEGDDGRAAAGQ
jgi:hypothetical protein